jgi:MYXO-CTERM domain-containing protein
MGGVAVGLFLAALVGILLWRRRKTYVQPLRPFDPRSY